MSRGNNRRSQSAAPNKYWAGRPLCIYCKKRRTVKHEVCYVCRRDGITGPLTPLWTEEQRREPQASDLAQSVAVRRAPITPKQPQSSGSGFAWLVAGVVLIVAVVWGSSGSSSSKSGSKSGYGQTRPRIHNSDVGVSGYTRRDGTYVAPHYRTRANLTKLDNYSTHPNMNPHTGKRGTRKW